MKLVYSFGVEVICVIVFCFYIDYLTMLNDFFLQLNLYKNYWYSYIILHRNDKLYKIIVVEIKLLLFVQKM